MLDSPVEITEYGGVCTNHSQTHGTVISQSPCRTYRLWMSLLAFSIKFYTQTHTLMSGLLGSFYNRKNWGSENSGKLSKSIKIINNITGIKTPFVNFYSCSSWWCLELGRHYINLVEENISTLSYHINYTIVLYYVTLYCTTL